MLNPYDMVGVSFWFVTIAMLLSTIFIFVERQAVSMPWRLPMTLSGLIMLLSTIHYYEMRGLWLEQQNVAISFRYLEWMLSFPLQLLAVYFVLQVCARKDSLLLSKFVMLPLTILSVGYCIEVGVFSGWWPLVLIAILWGCLLYTLWLGRGDRAMLSMVNLSGRAAYRGLRGIVTVGWLVYPLAYYASSAQIMDPEWINIVLNEIDCLNKLALVLIIWYSAYKDSGLLQSR